MSRGGWMDRLAPVLVVRLTRLALRAPVALAMAVAAIAVVTVLAGGGGAMRAAAQELGARARLAGDVTLEAGWSGLDLTVPLSQPVPWRTRLMSDPPRAVIDFRTLDWRGFDPESFRLAGAARALRVGDAGGGWTRLVLELDRPMGFAQAGMSTDPQTGGARLQVRLTPMSQAEFARQAARLAATDTAAPEDPAVAAAAPPLGQRPTVIVLDPGHGGVDPGAVHGGVSEADTMLTFARELAEALRRTGRYRVILTRDSDRFVSLEARITAAHEAHADVLLSLHADAVEDGQAVGATVYTLAEDASDEASARLAERHDRDNLMGGGVDLTGTDDAVASVLMQMARVQTAPATDRLARILVAAIRGADLRMHRHPWQQAAFSVLKSPSVPSVLVEVGFLSSQSDRARLSDRRWRARMQQALIRGLDSWVTEEASRAALSRR